MRAFALGVRSTQGVLSAISSARKLEGKQAAISSIPIQFNLFLSFLPRTRSQSGPEERQTSKMAVTTGGQASTGSAPLPSETASQETVPAQQLSIRNKLLFAQAVHRLGAPIGKSLGNNWNAVIDLLRKCPALSEEEKAIFTEHVSFGL